MIGIEIVLLVAGAMTFTLSFLIPSDGNSDTQEGGEPGSSSEKLKNTLESLVDSNEDEIRRRMREIAETEVDAAGDERKRNLEKITNEKIMAVDEYSKTVLDAIEKNHKEVVFLYDMLNNKSADLKNTIRKAEQTKREVEAERAAEELRAAQITQAARALREAENKHRADVEALSALKAVSETSSSAEEKKPENKSQELPTARQIIDETAAEIEKDNADRPEPVTQATPIIEQIKKLRENEKIGGVPQNLTPKKAKHKKELDMGMPSPEEIEASLDAGKPIFTDEDVITDEDEEPAEAAEEIITDTEDTVPVVVDEIKTEPEEVMA
ncbi:MAG: hypothetical protein K5894_04070, partial [Lachnospiraceae bacterium]|nr:hypothetical protein [Lachnospiraceae bacterium]